MTTTHPNEQRHVTACPLDCPDTCSIEVTVTDGVITKVDAAPGNPLTDGFICQKVKHNAKRVYAPERVLTPLIRTGPKGSGEFREASWDEALDLVVARLTETAEQHGAESIVPYVYNSSAGGLQSVLTDRLFHRLGATEVDHTICAATAGVAYYSVYGGMLSADPRDIVHSKLIVLWGANPTVSNTHLLPLITRAQKENGARLIVIDPRRTGVARRADAHLAVRVGTDVVLALAVARELAVNNWLDRDFLEAHVDGVDEYLAAADEWTVERAADVCDLDPHDITALARDLATIRPALMRPGWGLERNRNGGSAWVAVLALPALVGQFGERGAGLLVSLGAASPLTAGKRTPEEKHTPRPRHLNMNEFGAKLCDSSYEPNVKMLFVQGANPAVMNPNQNAVLKGLSRDDLFTVVHEQVLTDTARYADVVLPAATNFEYDDVADSYGTYTVQAMPKVIEPIGLAKSNGELASLLAERLGFPAERFAWNPDAFLPPLVGDEGVPNPVRVVREPGASVQFRDTFPAKGRVQLSGIHGIGVPRFQGLDTAFPLTLISPASPRLINSIFGEFNAPEPTIALHPDDAAARQLTDGDIVRVHNDQGELDVALKVDADLRPGVVVMAKGVWLRDMVSGLGVNALVPDSLSDLAGGACFNDTRVEVARR